MNVAHHPARLVSRSDAGGGMTIVTLDVPSELAGTYVSPGQYIEVRAGGEEGYFVLAGPPRSKPWELVMRRGGGVSDLLLASAEGLEVEVTAAIGDGFPVEDARGGTLIVALSGTGIAAARPLLARRLLDGDAARTQVYVGVRSSAELALTDYLGAWKRAGIDVVVCLSQGELPGAPEGVARGYVQDVVRARTPPGGWNDAWIFAVGVPSMVEALRALAPELGLPPERVVTNH